MSDEKKLTEAIDPRSGAPLVYAGRITTTEEELAKWLDNRGDVIGPPDLLAEDILARFGGGVVSVEELTLKVAEAVNGGWLVEGTWTYPKCAIVAKAIHALNLPRHVETAPADLWISVKERRPEDNGPLWSWDGEQVRLDWFGVDPRQVQPRFLFEIGSARKVTHFQPKPQPPKGGE